MRIVKYGRIKPTLITCHGCGAELEYCKRDIQVVACTPFVRCPVCGKAIHAPEKKQPEG